MVAFDKKNRALTNQQLSAIFAKAGRSGISERQLNLKVLTSLNDEIIAARGNKVADPIGAGINSIIAKRIVTVKPKKVKDVIEAVAKTNGITKEEARRELESANVIAGGISDEAVVGSSSEAQFNQIKQSLQQGKIKKIEKEIISKEIAKERHGTVASLPTGLQLTKINRKQLQELRKKLEAQQEERAKLINVAKVRDKLISQQDKLLKTRAEQLNKRISESNKVIDESGTGEKISREQLRALQGKATGVNPLAVAIMEGQDKQFQLQKKAFELRQLGFSPRLAEERAKIILNQ